MIGLLGSIAQPALFALEPEQAHKATIKALQNMPKALCKTKRYDSLETNIAGLTFANPLGMAAGFDKNAEVPLQLLNLGFGFTEVGTITPLAQPGNPAPRVFRLYKERSLINRLGFNNEGHAPALARLEKMPLTARSGPVGVNVGANKESEDRIADYVAGIKAFFPNADYFTVNISSPNTPGLRNLQHGDELKRLLNDVSEARSEQELIHKTVMRRPIFLKLAPDLEEEALDEIINIVNNSDFDGVIMSNTTLSRQGAENNDLHEEQGGLSGRLVFDRSTIMLAKTRQRLDKSKIVIGVGGIYNAQTALAKIEAGANLIQIYTGLIFEGIGVVNRILSGLDTVLLERDAMNITELVGTKTDEWAAKQV